MSRAFAFGCVLLTLTATLRGDEPATIGPHQDLSYYLTAGGEKQPIKTVEDWEIRKRQILENVQKVMGPLPDDSRKVPADLQVLEEMKVGELIRKKISYKTEADTRVNAYLFIPPHASDAKLPAVLCLHQTNNVGKDEPAGLGGLPTLHYALHLAERGYVTLAPDYPSFGEYKYDFAPSHGYQSGSMKAIWDNMRAVDLLVAMPEVNAERIGCIGHSLGGHNTMFTTLFDNRIKAAVSNCGFTRFHKYYGGKLQGWTSPRYMPKINLEYGNDPNKVPFDFPEIVASFAPRPFLARSPVGDDNFEVSGVKEALEIARPIYALYGAEAALQANYPDCKHDFPEDVRKVAYDFLDRALKN